MTDYVYAKRDIESLGDHYIRHIDRMTVEKLHKKSDIAAELAFRDSEIVRLNKDIERYRFLEQQQDVTWQTNDGQWIGGNGSCISEIIDTAIVRVAAEIGAKG